jgi:hypothetical protein
MPGASERDIPQVVDTVGLAQQRAAPSVELKGVFVSLAGAVVAGASQRDVAEALDAVSLAKQIAIPSAGLSKFAERWCGERCDIVNRPKPFSAAIASLRRLGRAETTA